MRPVSPVSAVQAIVLAAGLFACASAFAADATPRGDAVQGKADFERVGCWQCHGHLGQGGVGPRIAAPVPLPFSGLNIFVRTTDGNMPPFTEKVLSDQELRNIYAYLRSVPAGPDPKTLSLLNP